MSLSACTILRPKALSPLVVDSPHSGRIYPADFAYTCPLPLLRQAEDFLVDELVGGAVEAGATVIMAEFPRSYIDANRAENDIDAQVLASAWPVPLEPTRHTQQGLGLVRRLCRSGVPVYGAPIAVAEVEQRIQHYYRPYHAAIDRALEERQQAFGVAYLLNAHSMPSGDARTGERADFVLGDRAGTSCDPTFTRLVADLILDMGYSVAINEPYMGMEIVRRHGQPAKGRHALQLEINRRLYMDEARQEKNRGFQRLQQHLTQLFGLLAAAITENLSDRLAAE